MLKTFQLVLQCQRNPDGRGRIAHIQKGSNFQRDNKHGMGLILHGEVQLRLEVFRIQRLLLNLPRSKGSARAALMDSYANATASLLDSRFLPDVGDMSDLGDFWANR